MKLTGKIKTTLKTILFTAVVLALVIVSAYGLRQNVEGGDNMALRGTIPPIDAVAPVQTETATFSLG